MKNPFPKTLFSIGILVLISAHILYAQPQEFKFKHLSIDDGLSHSKVNVIFQDSRGFMWFGTNEGLNRYDGYDFKVFQRDPDNSYSISSNLIRTIVEDSSGYLWIGTEGGGLNRYDRKTERFIHFTNDSSSETILNSNNVNDILLDSHNQIWIGTEHGIDLIELIDKKATNFLPYPPEKELAGENIINVLFKDHENKIWAGTESGGFCCFDDETRQFYCYRHNPSDPKSISDNRIRSIIEDNQGHLWIGTYNGGLNLFDRENKVFTSFYPDINILESRTMKAILDDGSDSFWLGTRNGLYIFNKKNHQFTHQAHNPSIPHSLSQNNIEAIIRDKKGDIWLGTWGGINFFNTTNIAFRHYRAEDNNQKYLNHSAVYSILKDSRGDLWFGTEEGGLNRLNHKTGLFDYYLYNTDNPNSISSNNIKTILEDHQGNLWIGTYQGGLNLFNRQRHEFIHFKHDPDDPRSLSDNDVLCILEDRDGEFWIGTNGAGLNRFDRKTQQFTHYDLSHNGLTYDDVRTLYQDSEGKIWVGAEESQICVIDKNKNENKHFKLSIPLSGVEVSSILEDRQSNLWIGTIGGGLYRFNRENEQFQNFKIKDGLPSNIILGLLQDEHENIWLSTTNGLVRFNLLTEEVNHFTRENGLQSDQFNYNAYYKARDGQFFFGGINGVTAFYPDSVERNQYIPPVVITDFQIFNKSVTIGGQDHILKHHISETNHLILSYRHSVLTFEFVALNYVYSEKNQYAYFMKGFDGDWNYVGTKRSATYTNLNPGEYLFQVKAANNDGQWNSEGTAIKITITPPIWKTWWFRIITFSLIILIAVLIMNHFMEYQNQKRNVLRAMALANQAQLNLLRYQMNPHFLFNAHNSIRSMILIDKERAWQMITKLSDFFRYTLLNINKVETTLEEEINATNNYLHIEKIRYKDSLKVTSQIDDEALDCRVPAFLIQPIIENAIKYGMQTSPQPLHVKMIISYKKGFVSIDISNSGKLISKSKQHESQQDTPSAALQNIQKRLQLLFQGNATFQLYEKDGWVHAKIRINYNKIKKNRPIMTENTEENQYSWFSTDIR